MSTGYEAGGYGLVELDGKVTERAVEAGKIAKIITKNMPLFLDSRPPRAEAAILYNPLSHMVGGQQTFTGEGQAIGYNNLSESLQGIHRAFFESQIPVDFLHVMDLRPERLSQYKLLVVPYPVMMARADIKKLISYVENGGVLVAEARCGWVDERGFSSDIIPGGGLHEVLGCRESYLMPLAKTAVLKIKGTPEALPLLREGDKLDTLFFEEGFELIDDRAQVLAEYENGKPAMVYAPYGKGKAIIVGSFLGSAYHHFKNPNNGKFFAGLAEWLKLTKPVEVAVLEKDVLVEARMLLAENRSILFGFNRGEKKATAEFAVAAPAGGLKARNLETNEEIPVRVTEGRAVLAKTLEPGEAWVVLMEKK
jgi:beta-galactosidase